jgi:imidazolonepropionase-like amidohydrolase
MTTDMAGILRLLTPVANVLALALLISRQRVVRSLESAGAIAPSSAIALAPSSPLARWWHRRLSSAGVIRTDGGRSWLDRSAWADYRAVRRRRALVVAAVLVAGLALWLFARPAAAIQAETTVLRVSLIERPIGTERSELVSSPDEHELTSTMDLTERGGRLQLTASMRLAADLTPVRYTARGRTYRFVPVDVDIEIADRRARIRQAGVSADVEAPDRFFTALGYAPLAARALLIRYWERHERPATLPVIPGNGAATRTVSIEARGNDVVRVEGRDVRLRRFTVNGIVWGRETVWLDERNRLAAIVTRIHILPLEAVREDLAGAQPELLDIAARDAASDLTRMAAAQTPIASGAFALTGATVVDGTGAPPRGDVTLLIRDGRIAAVGSRGAVAIPAGTRAIDARGATIVPGLWDLHAHASQIEWAPAYLAAGVTTIRDMGGERRFLLALRDAIAHGRGLGPRVLLAGLVDGEAPNAFGAVAAATPAAGRAVVDRYHADRFEQIKLYSLLQPEVVAAIAARAHELKMTVTGHVPSALGARRAVEAGMDQIAHMPLGGDLQSPETKALIALLAARNVVVDPTAPWGELLGRAPETPVDRIEPGLAKGPPALAISYRSVTNQTDAPTARARVERQLAAIKALHDAGVPIVAGTDGAVPGHSLLRSIELFVEAGLTPMEALQSATIVPARAMGLEQDSGTIEPGKRADLLVLDASPLADVGNIRRARWVVAGGRLYGVAQLWNEVNR